MASTWDHVTFGATGLRVSPIGVASSYGVGSPDVERAFERGINFFFWGSIRRGGFADGVRNLTREHRGELVIAVQSYTRVGALMRPSIESALRRLGTDYVDVLCLAWWNDAPSRRIFDAAVALRDKGKVRHIMVSCHHRPSFTDIAREPAVDGIMVRYNAAHPGAEREVFPYLGDRSPGVLAFTGTRWGSLLDPKLTPPGEATPRASDCYRFQLADAHVHACLTGPKNGAELDEALAALDRGPMSAAEVAWMRRVGEVVRRDASAHRPMRWIDSAQGALFGRRDRRGAA